ncbi:DUF3592 domain-containing protein [Desulfonatronum sp. SC1]|uniref:DUF3592 domain-containing protein n=1 Tax=Desulfonatronum sp. SC1 TaxID=2109626 RepID=UPI0011B20A62|nr:DUF3592 domain-containing protein [Desulfonatronum sp. SC1]
MHRADLEQKRKTAGFWIGLPLMMVFLVGGIVGIVKGGSGIWLERELQNRGLTAEGEVVKVTSKRTSPSSGEPAKHWKVTTYCFTVDGAAFENTIEVSAQLSYERGIPLPREGDRILVHYLSEEPTSNWPLMYRVGWWNWFMFGFGLLLAGSSAFVLAGMIMVRLRGARRAEQARRSTR